MVLHHYTLPSPKITTFLLIVSVYETLTLITRALESLMFLDINGEEMGEELLYRLKFDPVPLHTDDKGISITCEFRYKGRVRREGYSTHETNGKMSPES